MPHASDAHSLGRIVDNIDHAPIAHPKTPLIFVAPEFFASRRSGIVGQGENLAVNAAKKRIVKRVQLFLRGQFDFEVVASHAGGCVSNGRRGIARKEYLFLSGAPRK